MDWALFIVSGIVLILIAGWMLFIGFGGPGLESPYPPIVGCIGVICLIIGFARARVLFQRWINR